MKPDRVSTQEEDFILATRIRDERCEDSFNQLYAKHKQLVQWKCYRVLCNQQDAEDAVQVVFTKFWHKECQAWRGGHVKGFLCSIARYVSLNMWRFARAQRRSGDMLFLDEENDEGEPLYQVADARVEYETDRESEVEAEIDRVLEMLTMPQWRLAWILERREGYPASKVGEILGVSTRQAVAWRKKAEDFIKSASAAFYERLRGRRMDDAQWLDNRVRLRGLFKNEEV